MEEKQEKQKEKERCEECKEKAWKYKCPRCSLRTCSLHCVNTHKLRTLCSGKRDRTHFVPLSQFNDNILLSDYYLLEEIKSVAEVAAAKRMRTMTKLSNFSPLLRSLKKAASKRGTKLLFLSNGMSMRETNNSRFHHSKNLIFWTIEWRFHSTDVILLDHGVSEDTNLCSVFERHVQPGPWNHQLRQFLLEPLDSLKFYIRKYPRGHNSPFCELDIQSPLRQQLADVFILEYPVIFVFLPSHSLDFEVVNIKHPAAQRSEIKRLDSSNHLSPSGVTFRVEDIEAENNPDTQDCDLLSSSATNIELEQVSSCDILRKALVGSLNGPVPLSGAVSNSSHFGSTNLEPGVFGTTEFDLDQGLLDAYSDFIGQMNPDETFYLEGEHPKEEVLSCNMSRNVLDGSFNCPLSPSGAVSNYSPFSSTNLVPGMFGAMEFDLEQGLLDACSDDLIAHMNPDEFFNFEGEHPKEDEVEDKKNLLDSRGSAVMEEELEEGEIVE